MFIQCPKCSSDAKRNDVPYGHASMLAKGAKRPSQTTYMQTISNKSSSNILAVTALKASNLNSTVWDQIFIFCCMNRHRINERSGN